MFKGFNWDGSSMLMGSVIAFVWKDHLSAWWLLTAFVFLFDHPTFTLFRFSLNDGKWSFRWGNK